MAVVSMSYTGFEMGEEDPRKKRFCGLRMKPSLWEKLEQEAERKETKVSEVIRELCENGLENDNRSRLNAIRANNSLSG